MSFSTTYNAKEVLVLNEAETIVWGTCMLGTTYGEIISCSVSREFNTQEIMNCVGGLAAFIMNNPRFEMTIEARMDSDVTAPGPGDQILFPIPAVYGRVMPGVTINWEQNGARRLSIPATFWDELSGAPLNLWNGSSNTQVDDGSDPE